MAKTAGDQFVLFCIAETSGDCGDCALNGELAHALYPASAETGEFIIGANIMVHELVSATVKNEASATYRAVERLRLAQVESVRSIHARGLCAEQCDWGSARTSIAFVARAMDVRSFPRCKATRCADTWPVKTAPRLR